MWTDICFYYSFTTIIPCVPWAYKLFLLLPKLRFCYYSFTTIIPCVPWAYKLFELSNMIRFHIIFLVEGYPSLAHSGIVKMFQTHPTMVVNRMTSNQPPCSVGVSMLTTQPNSANCLQSLKDKIYIIALDNDNGDTFYYSISSYKKMINY